MMIIKTNPINMSKPSIIISSSSSRLVVVVVINMFTKDEGRKLQCKRDTE